jgi:hypothetical protein
LPRGLGAAPRRPAAERPRPLVPFVARAFAFTWLGVVLALIAQRLIA